MGKGIEDALENSTSDASLARARAVSAKIEAGQLDRLKAST